MEQSTLDVAAPADALGEDFKRGLAETHCVEGLSDAAFSIIIANSFWGFIAPMPHRED
jgi:hypothetical protein